MKIRRHADAEAWASSRHRGPGATFFHLPGRLEAEAVASGGRFEGLVAGLGDGDAALLPAHLGADRALLDLGPELPASVAPDEGAFQRRVVTRPARHPWLKRCRPRWLGRRKEAS